MKSLVRQLGSTLIEVLITVSLLGTGLLATGKFQTNMISGNNIAKQRGEALVVTQEKLEDLRGYGTLTASGSAPAYDSIASGQDTTTGRNATYTRTWTVTTYTNPSYKTVNVVTTWTATDNSNQSVMLGSHISRKDPATQGNALAALSTGTVSTPSTGGSGSTSTSSGAGGSSGSTGSTTGSDSGTSTSSGSGSTGSSGSSTSGSTGSSGSSGSTSCQSQSRSAAIPSAAINNCNGTSSYAITSSITLTYDNTTGAITLVNGSSAVSIGGSLTIATGGNAPTPGKTTSNVTIGSTASNIYCFYTTTSTTAASYTCYASSGWSGAILISGSTGFKVCRSYTTSPYANVTGNLTTQNYSMIKSTKTCSTAMPSTPTLHQTL
jgi:Tfp pilus assembly protein PilV